MYDVVIVGAGPSGLSCALSLYDLGVKKILVLEKYKFPRYKCCAGYITLNTKKVFESFGVDFKKCYYSLIDDFNIFYKNKKYQNIKNKFLYTNRNIERVELDNAFYELAKDKVEIVENVNILEHDIDNNKVVISDNRVIKYKNIVFADGMSGYSLRYRKSNKKNIAIQATFKRDMPDKIDIHFGVTKHGYAWVSSFMGNVNVGLTDCYDKSINYREVFEKYLTSLGFDSDNIKGAFTPIGLEKPIINDNVYFIGDAVGACDPFTLSGLRYGLQSGKKCAETIYYGNKSIYIKYIKKLKFKFGIMRFIMKVFYLKQIQFCVFKIGCPVFGKLIEVVFNNYFVNKK